MDLSLNDYLLIFIIITSGLLLLFPQALSGGVRMINVKNSVLLMNREACIIIDVRSQYIEVLTHHVDEFFQII